MRTKSVYTDRALLQNFRGQYSGGSLAGHFLNGMLDMLSFEGISLTSLPPTYPTDAGSHDLVRVGQDMYREIGKIDGELVSGRTYDP